MRHALYVCLDEATWLTVNNMAYNRVRAVYTAEYLRVAAETLKRRSLAAIAVRGAGPRPRMTYPRPQQQTCTRGYMRLVHYYYYYY